MSNILITSAGRRVFLVKAFKEELKKINPYGSVFVTDLQPMLSPAAQIADKAFEVCNVNDGMYIDDLLKLSLENEVSIIIPTIDTELLILSKNKEKFLSHGISLIVSSEDLVEICRDKVKTQNFFNDSNIEVARVYDKKNYSLPVYIKPINGSSSVDNYIIKNHDQISKYFLENDSLVFFEYLDHDIYDEYTCDLYYDKNSHLKCVIPRKRIEVRGGEVSKGITKKNILKTLIENKFSYLEGAMGCITFQFFVHNKTNEVKGIEINARFGGGYPLSYLAGGNYPKWIIEEYFLNKEISYHSEWEENLLMLRYDDEILVHDYKDKKHSSYKDEKHSYF